MLPGSTYIYECPNCQNKIANGSLMSGNTFGAIHYSDGFMHAPMLPEFTAITKCKKCDTIFWLKNNSEITELKPFADTNSNFDDVQNAEFLNIEEYNLALEQKIYSSTEEEMYLRQHLLWSINSTERGKNKIIPNFKYKKIKQKNTEKLLEILDLNIPEQRILVAELHRNSGNFEKCMEVLDNLEGFEKIKNQFKIECEKKNTKVFQLTNK
ncbi:MAG: hypothetical protein JXL97_11730 [Bacteroidales bacterium]|nr:hypothetical protein [Bacteroidales bacterium]